MHPERDSDLPSDPAARARQAEDLARRFPGQREEYLIEAAGEWAAAGEYDRALALHERLLAEGCQDPHEVEAFRIGALWDAGREPEARAAAARLRARHPHSGGAWNWVAETFEAGGDLHTAHEWYTAGITHLLGAALDTRAVRASGIDAEQLFIGRHRVRRLLGLPHDDWDAVADTLHGDHSSVPLDDAHAPDRLRAAHAPEPLRAQLTPHPEAVLHWPEPEFTELLRRRPALADVFGPDHPTHLSRTELRLRTLPHPCVAHATVAAYEAFAHDRGVPPDTPALADAYAAHLAAQGRTTPWPPARNAPCWCGSGRKYKRCCGRVEDSGGVGPTSDI